MRDKTTPLPPHKRFIRMDGTSWHAGGMTSLFQSVSVRTGATGFAGYLGLAALQAATGAGTPMGSGFTMLAGLMIPLSALASRGFELSLRNTFLHPSAGFAIDREGRAIPPRELPQLMQDVESIHSQNARNGTAALRQAGLAGIFAVVVCSMEVQAVAFMPMLAALPGVARCVSTKARCRKILDGTYRFCQNPPAQEQKARAMPKGATAQPEM